MFKNLGRSVPVAVLFVLGSFAQDEIRKYPRFLCHSLRRRLPNIFMFYLCGFRRFASTGLQRVGFNKNLLDGWLLLANTGFQPINRGFNLLDIPAATEPDVHSEQDLVGSPLHG